MIMKLGGSGILEAFSDIRRDPHMIPHVYGEVRSKGQKTSWALLPYRPRLLIRYSGQF